MKTFKILLANSLLAGVTNNFVWFALIFWGYLETQSVLVTDDHSRVVLSLSACTYPAGLTPDQARFIAQELIDSAKRVEDAIYKKAGAK